MGTLSSFEDVLETRSSPESHRILTAQIRPPEVCLSIILNVAAGATETENGILRVLVWLNRIVEVLDDVDWGHRETSRH
jgi:hypothetical protein